VGLLKSDDECLVFVGELLDNADLVCGEPLPKFFDPSQICGLTTPLFTLSMSNLCPLHTKHLCKVVSFFLTSKPDFTCLVFILTLKFTYLSASAMEADGSKNFSTLQSSDFCLSANFCQFFVNPGLLKRFISVGFLFFPIYVHCSFMCNLSV